MAKLLVVGMGPLFEDGVRNFGAQGLRTWFFAKPLLDNVIRIVGPGQAEFPIRGPMEKGREGVRDRVTEDASPAYTGHSTVSTLHCRYTTA